LLLYFNRIINYLKLFKEFIKQLILKRVQSAKNFITGFEDEYNPKEFRVSENYEIKKSSTVNMMNNAGNNSDNASGANNGYQDNPPTTSQSYHPLGDNRPLRNWLNNLFPSIAGNRIVTLATRSLRGR
jgi:hypothetical protein